MAGETETVGGASAPSAAPAPAPTSAEVPQRVRAFMQDRLARLLAANYRPAANGEAEAMLHELLRCEAFTTWLRATASGGAAPPTLTDEDTKRLDWLEDNMAFLEPLDGAREWVVDYHGGRRLGPSLRAAIDSAIAASLQAEGKAMCQACYYGSTRDKGICSVCEGTGVVPASSASRRAVEACDNPFGRDAARRRVRAS